MSEDLFHVKATLVNDLYSEVDDLVQHLSHGEPILVPYDCDKNHDPTMKDGKTAHWATIVGYAVEIEEKSEETSPVVFKSPPVNADETSAIVSRVNSTGGKKLLLFAKQGKSKFMRLWTFDELCRSNLNLRYASHPATSSCSKDNARNAPPPRAQDLSQSLAKKAVVLRRNQ